MLDRTGLSVSSISSQSLRWRLSLGVILVNLFVLFLAASSLRQSWHQYQDRAETTAKNLSRVLEGEIGGDIEKIDITLLAAGDEVMRQFSSGKVGQKELNDFLLRQQSLLREIDSLCVADERGSVAYGNPATPGIANVAERKFFASQRDNANAGLVIDRPVQTRSDNRWSLPMSRRINHPDGSFAGVVYVNLSLDHLVKTFSKLDLGSKGVANLRDLDLNILARYPERLGAASAIGKPTISLPLKQLIDAGQTAGTYRVAAVLDNVERAYSYRKIGDYPLYVTVGLASEDYLADWRTSLVKEAAWGILFFVATLLTSLLIYRALMRQQNAYESLYNSEERFLDAFENAPIGMAIVALDGTFSKVNQALCQILGYERAELKKLRFQDITHPDDLDADLANIKRLLDGEIGAFQMEKRYIRSDDQIVWVQVTGSIVRDAKNTPLHFLAQVENITDRKKVEAQIEFLAYHDALTKLPNRLLARDHLEMAIAYTERAGTKTAVLFLDLDNFKTINDSFGHAIGDELLIAVAERLRECTHETDTISRQGGDEFLIVLSDVPDAEAITLFAEKILERLEETFIIGGNEIATSLSVGIAVYPDDSKDIDTLLKFADRAMYHAKGAGRNAFRFYTEQMNVDAVAHQHIRVGLRRALEHGELALHYQPQISLSSGAVIGAEALIRWNHPELGLLLPATFLPTAEESGLIVPMGDWVLQEACRQAVEWLEAGLPEFVMAVNISAMQFTRGDLEQSVLRALADSGLPPALLELELTESILIQDTEKVLETVQRLKSHGLMLSIDDFGTGYSSLSYLKRFNVDKLKIDRSFICDMINNPNDATIVRAIIQMARNLNLKTIAEGVEDEHLLSFLRLQYCDEGQGYYFSRPLPADEFARYVANNTQQLKLIP
ncbi:hypothetical protein SKTS_16280 [Sulfurimicrobium lacus]|uniref:GGDEF domain-containing protein n=1 Tax=Sulfurimicrobium lacus TaxID=2715678 RepID=A0A6F8VCQ6_9PROT|nr:hypothetical protein SKTS_16280 [Sulfurimicrobium lacus]